MFLADLESRERKYQSQNGEDGVIAAIFAEIGLTNQFCVELGCGDGGECNTAQLARQGWSGLWIDGGGMESRTPGLTIQNEFITAESIDALFRRFAVPERFDLLSIDIDGNDFWVWKQIVHRPRVVVIEYNAAAPPHLARAIRYDPAFVWSGKTDYYGASLLALKMLGEQKGYTLVHCEGAGVNAFFVANEELPADYVPPRIEEIYRRANYFYRGLEWGRDPNQQMIDPFA